MFLPDNNCSAVHCPMHRPSHAADDVIMIPALYLSTYLQLLAYVLDW